MKMQACMVCQSRGHVLLDNQWGRKYSVRCPKCAGKCYIMVEEEFKSPLSKKAPETVVRKFGWFFGTNQAD